MIEAKYLRTRFDETDEFTRIYDGNRYFIMIGSEKYYIIYDRIRFLVRYLVGVKSGITYVLSHYPTKSTLIFKTLFS